MMAAPMGVSPVGERVGGWNMSAVWKSDSTLTGPKVMMATSTRWEAIESELSSSWNTRSPALSSAMGLPFIDPDVSSSRRHGHRGSGFSIKLGGTNGIWSE